VNHLVFLLLQLEVWNIELPDRLDRQVQGRAGWLVAAAQVLLYLAQRAQHPRAIESLTLTVIAKTHRWHLFRWERDRIFMILAVR
jgi:hypothetical protein